MPSAALILHLLPWSAVPLEAAPAEPAEMVVEEEEVVFADEEDEGQTRPAALTLIPEHDYELWLLLFPALVLLALAWNVGWRAPGRHRGGPRERATKHPQKNATAEAESAQSSEASP